jgi:hypothetical protein
LNLINVNGKIDSLLPGFKEMNFQQYRTILKKNGHIKKSSDTKLTEPITVGGSYHDEDYFWFNVSWRSGIAHVEKYGKSSELIQAETAWAELYNNHAHWMNQAMITSTGILWDEESLEEASKLVEAGTIPDEYVFVFDKLGINPSN